MGCNRKGLKGVFDWFVGDQEKYQKSCCAESLAASPSRQSCLPGCKLPPFKRKALFETLEPRLLLSADLLPCAEAPSDSNDRVEAAEILTLPATTFSLNLTVPDAPPTVISSSLPEGSVISPGDLQVEIGFSEDLDVVGLGAEDLVLMDAESNVHVTTDFSYDNATNTVTAFFADLGEGDYSLSAVSGLDAFHDLDGDLLDGAPSTSLPSGDGTSGDDYVVNFSVDVDDRSFPVLESADPFGSLIYHGRVGGHVYAGDTDDFSLTLEPGQLVQILLEPDDASLQGRLSLFDSTGDLLNSIDATTAGAPLLLLDSAIETGGVYRIEVESIGGSGDYKVALLLNDLVEQEAITGIANDELVSAEPLDAAEGLMSINAGERSAVTGWLNDGIAWLNDGVGAVDGEDWYHFSLAEGEAATLALEDLSEGGVPLQLELYDAAGQLLTQGVSEGSSVDQVVDGFVADVAGTFYVRVSSEGDTEYTLLLTRNAGFDLDSAEATQVLSPSGRVLGAIDGGDGVIDVAVLRGEDNRSAVALAQLNDDTWFNFNAVSVTVDQIDTLEELSAYDTVVLGDYSMWSSIGQVAPALRAWAEAGGGVVTTGHGLRHIHNFTYGQNQTDLDAVIPVQGVGGYGGASGTLYIQNTDHAVTAGLSGVHSDGSHYATNGIDDGATVLGLVGTAETVVVADAGSGHTVYLGARYADTTSYNDLRSGEADRLFEQAVAWAASGSIDRVDQYLIEVQEGDELRITTAAPGGATGEFVNEIDPVLTLYTADGSVVATDDNSLDGHDALITYTVPTGEGGQYRVEVSGARAGDDRGEYLLSVEGASGPVVAFEVSGSNIANGAGLHDFPDTLRIDLSAPVLQTSVAAADLTVNGVTADSVTFIDADTLEFSIAAADTGDGIYTVEMAAGALTSIGNQPIEAGSATFTVDTIIPTVITSSLSEGDVLGAGDLQVEIAFSETLAAEVLGSEDLVLVDSNEDTFAVDSFFYDDDSSVLSVGFTGLKDGSYTLTLVSS
ncbi:MAG: LEPR-XLL domain-containing protein [Sedimenticola sp.]